MSTLKLEKPLRYNVQWDCPKCGNSHNWWWEDKFEAYSETESMMTCDRCQVSTWCRGDGNGFYEPIADDKRRLEELESLELDLHNYVRGLEDKVNTNNKLAFDAINTVTMRLMKLEDEVAQQRSELDNLGRRTTEAELAIWRLENDIKVPGNAKLGPQHVELAKEKEKSFLDLIHGEKPPFHERIREGCRLEDMDGITLASILRFVAVEVERMTERDMGGSFTISNVKAAAKLRELADEAELADCHYSDEEDDE